MGQTLQLGPLTLPWAFIVFLIGWLAATRLCELLARRHGAKAGPHIAAIALVGLLAARLAFVLQYASAYSSHPPSIIDIRDGGWEPIAGLAAIGVYALALWIWRGRSAGAVTAGAALFAAIWLGGNAALSMLAPQGARLPEFKGVALDAATLSFPDLQGKPAVINLWATWCPPCRREMPALLAAQKAHPEVRFVWVNQGERPETVLRYIQQIGLSPSDVVMDSNESLSRALRQRALPTTLFFDAHGRQVAVRSGELSHATLAQHMEQLTASR